jgi:H+/Cl- antiporter ClcA
MQPHLKHDIFAIRKNATAFVKWLAFACLIGIVTGLVGTAFHYALDWATETRTANSWLIYLLPIAGLIIVASYRVTRMEDDKGTEFVIGAVREGRVLRFRTAPLIFLGTVLTHLTGGSAGREGAALQLGGCVSGSLGKLLRLDDKDERIITMCGMAGGFSALFGTPLAAAVFAMEVESIGVMYYAALVPCVLSALIANLVSSAFGVASTSFTLTFIPAFSPVVFIQVIALGVVFAILANLFCRAMSGSSYLYKKIKNPYIRIFAGGVVVILLTLLVRTNDYNGAGMNVITAALAGDVVPWAFALKIVFTALTLGAGFKGGEIVPCFFVGATSGAAIAPLIGMDGGYGGALGLIAVFCGVTNSPMTSILLGYELFGGQGVALMALCAAVSYLLSGYSGLYHEQKIMYSKTSPVFLGRKSGELSQPQEEETKE